jgi:hypothetical protein
MKKILILLVIAMAAGTMAKAQDYKTSLGLRAGLPYGVTLKHFLNKTDALEGILAGRYGGFVITGLWENEHWTGKYPGLNWYWGVGANVGFWGTGENPHLDVADSGATIGANGVLGLEYTFDDFPLNLSLDVMPAVNLFSSTVWFEVNGGLSIRYVF